MAKLITDRLVIKLDQGEISLDKNCYLGYAINTEARLPLWNGVINNMWGKNKRENVISAMLEKPQFWYLMGRYVGDGWKKTSRDGQWMFIILLQTSSVRIILWHS